jgi:solute carrier family 13 (sodium-dependent dicarboxylate transporter), member 2/3/5
MGKAPTIISKPPIATRPEIRVDIFGLLAAVLAAAIVLLLPTPAGLSPAGQRLAALFAGALVLWVTEAIPIAMTAIMTIGLQPLMGVNPLPLAISNFINTVFFFMLVMYVIALVWTKTGLSRRFALWMISKAGTDTKRVLLTFMLGTGAISTIMSDVPAAAVFMAIALGVFEKLKLKPGHSQFGKSIMIGIPIASYIGGVGTPAGSAINILGLALIERGGGPRIPFLHWMAIGMPMVIIMLPIAAWVISKFYPAEMKTIGDIGDIKRELKQLGPITGNERKLIGIMGAMIALWILNTWFPAFDILLVGIGGAALMFMPGFKLCTWQEVQDNTGWDTMVMMGGVTSLGIASTTTGLAKFLVDASLGELQDWNILWVVAAISAFTVAAHLVIPVNPALVAVMIPPILILATTAGQNPALYALPVVFTVSCAFLFPLDPVPLVTYSKGYYRMTDMFLPGLVLSVVWVIVMTTLFMIVGPILGWV